MQVYVFCHLCIISRGFASLFSHPPVFSMVPYAMEPCSLHKGHGYTTKANIMIKTTSRYLLFKEIVIVQCGLDKWNLYRNYTCLLD